MFEGDPPELETIERRLITALDIGHVRTRDAINALTNLLTLALATIACPDCRRVAADHLRAAVPEMLETADAMAAAAKEAGFPSVERHLH